MRIFRIHTFAAIMLIPAAVIQSAAANDRPLPGVPLLNVAVNEARIVPLPSAPDTVVLGNPAIADVTPQAARRLIVTGKSIGQTNLIVLAPDGRELLNTRISVHGAAENAVSLFSGGGRQELHCAPLCDKPGDPRAPAQAKPAAEPAPAGQDAPAVAAEPERQGR